MPSRVDFFTYDYSGEKSGLSLNLRNSASGGEYNNRLAEITALQTAIEGISVATWGNYDFVSAIYQETGSLPASPYAQRESRALFDCVSTGGERFVIGIPCPDLDNMAIPGTDAINLTDPQVLAYVAVVESDARSPLGNAVTIIGGKIVGRNN